MSIKRYDNNGRFHTAVKHNDTLYLSGQVALNSGTITEQTKECLDNLEKLLEKYGSGKDQVLSATVYLANIADFEAFNSVWDHWFEPGTQPVRTCVEAHLAGPAFLVEITLIAAVRE